MADINVFDATTGQVIVRPYTSEEIAFVADVASIPLSEHGIEPDPQA